MTLNTRVTRLLILTVGFLIIMSCQKKKHLMSVVQIKSGVVGGVLSEDEGVVAFKGIPYAAPPVDDLRWKAPQPVEPWQGIKCCDRFSASAMQSDPVPFLMWTKEFIAPAEPLSEDCLYLNVWTSAKSKTDKLPVMVFIHGGAFMSGSGSVPVYDGEEIAKKGVVFVTINYRVGIFGFFSHPELSAEAPYGSSGNYGLLDQVAALKWVHENIAAFGGDPDRVTIAGQSAGAFSVNFLVASPLARGLFHRAIAESGGAVLPASRFIDMKSQKEAEQLGVDIAKALNSESIPELREIPAKDLLEVKVMHAPIIDGYFLSNDLYSIFKEGRQNDVPLILGWNADEGNMGGPIVDAAIFKQYADDEFGEESETFLTYFPADNDSIAKEAQGILSGLQTFGLQAYEWMKLQNKSGKSNVFMYHFTRKMPHGEGQQAYGAFHTAEVPYAYSNLKKSDVRPWEDVDYQLAEMMSSYWVNFARNGDPNGAGLPEWSPCQEDEYPVIYFGETVDQRSLPHKEKLAFLERIYERNLQ